MKIRLATSKDMMAVAKIYVDTWRTTYTGLVPDVYLEQLTVQRAEQKWIQFLNDFSQDTFLYVVLNEKGIIIGFAAAQIHANAGVRKGELSALYILPEAHGLGIGKKLMETVSVHFLKAEVSSMMVWVMKKNEPGRAFYKRLGGKYIGHRQSRFGNVTVEDEAYEWLDVAMLIHHQN
ncbi:MULTISPECIES: GNAT family N-acetyltransferase [Exiguobacterium]|uniref:GNAT family N-acetyltransferase n=1 Tax=Exiguobacterium TaxID=33986 RepID=UPI0011F009E0|nr:MULTISPECIES: GNAT family N-acetyltransferase [Exiguobacterium]